MRVLPIDYAVRNLGRRPRQTLLVGIAACVTALCALAAGGFLRGIDRALIQSGDAHNAILLGAGSEESVERSEIQVDLAGIAAASIRGIRERMGVRFVSPEVHLCLRVGARDDAELTMVRGITERAFLVRPRVRIVAGRAPAPGRDEVVLGRGAAERLFGRGDVLGAVLRVDDLEHTVVGVLEAPGTVVESEVWSPLTDLLALARRGELSCVVLTLDDPSDFASVEAFALRRLDLEVAALREDEYYAAVGRLLAPVRTLALSTAVLTALAAALGGLNALFASFAGRTRELAALQVLGFRRRAIVWSLVQESLVVHACGGLVATVLALAVLDGVAVRFSTGSIGLEIDAVAVSAGLGATLALGAFGALLPAIRALRPRLPDALRAT